MATDELAAAIFAVHFHEFLQIYRLKMAHPLFLVECAVRKFVQHWHLGLQPTLSLRTLPIGEISVNIDVVSSTAGNCRRQKSGRRSREKRRNRRSSDIVLTNTVETSERNNKVEADDTVKEVRIESISIIESEKVLSHKIAEKKS